MLLYYVMLFILYYSKAPESLVSFRCGLELLEDMIITTMLRNKPY